MINYILLAEQINIMSIMVPYTMVFSMFLLLAVIIIIAKRRKYYKSEYWKITNANYFSIKFDKGKTGEYKTITKIFELPIEKKILVNVYLPKANDISKTTEIDIIAITNRAIYVIENKNYSGKIYGTDTQFYWYYYLGGKKYKVYNPIMQNETHIKALKKIISNEDLIYSIVCFNSNMNIDKINTSSVIVCNENNIKNTIMNIESNLPYKYSNDDIDRIFNVIRPYNEVSDEFKQQHIDNIKKQESNES
ncbi:MAG: nuclease-related domain-containing protein [Oscillospiraceae bacterium]